MNKPIFSLSKVKLLFLFLGPALLLPPGGVYAGINSETDISAMLPPPAREDQLMLNHRLQAARRDIDAFRIFAESFCENGDMKTLEQLQNPVDDFLKKHVDNLLALTADLSTLESNRLAAEIMFIKTRLLLSLNRREAAGNTVADMKKRFGSYPKISVELPGKTTTLDEGIRMLDAELTKTATASE